MPFTRLDLITVTGKYILLNGSPAAGTVSFAASQTLIDSVANEIVVPVAITAVLGVDGTVSVVLPATDDPDLAPTGWAYTVTENILGARVQRTYMIQLSVSLPGDTVDLADLVPVEAVTPTSPYALVGHTHTGLTLDTPLVLQPDVIGESALQLKALAGQVAPLLTVTDDVDSVKLQITRDSDVRWLQSDGTIYNIATFEVPWANGPLGESVYTDHVAAFGYNIGSGGVAVDGTKAAAWLQFESKFYQTFLDGTTDFGSEIHFNFRRPSGAGGIPRPWGASLNHSTGGISQSVRGSVAWEKSDGSGVSMQLNETSNLLSLADGLSLSVTPTSTADATIDVGGREATLPSIFAFAGATQTTDLLSLRTPANANALQVKVGGEVNVGAAGLVVNFTQNDGSAVTIQPPANGQAAIYIRRRAAQTADVLQVWNSTADVALFSVDKDGAPILRRASDNARFRLTVDEDGLLETTQV